MIRRVIDISSGPTKLSLKHHQMIIRQEEVRNQVGQDQTYWGPY
jgi:hypothetical protein